MNKIKLEMIEWILDNNTLLSVLLPERLRHIINNTIDKNLIRVKVKNK